jgi:hypothetical protein
MVCHPCGLGSVINSGNTAHPISLDNRGKQVVLLHLLKAMLLLNLFEVLAIGVQTFSSDTFGRTLLFFMHLFLDVPSITRRMINFYFTILSHTLIWTVPEISHLPIIFYPQISLFLISHLK